MRSLRSRLALISCLVSGITIVLLSLFVWTFIHKSLTEALDLTLTVNVERMSSDLHPRANFTVIENQIQIANRDDLKSGKVLILLRDEIEQKVIFQGPTEDWLIQIDPVFWQGSAEEVARLHNSPKRPAFHPNDLRRPYPDSAYVDETEAFLLELLGERPSGTKGSPKGIKGKGKGKANEQIELGKTFDYTTTTINGANYRLGVLRERGYVSLFGIRLDETEAELNQIRRGFFIGLPLALILIGASGWFIADRAIRPVRMITERTRKITAKGLDERIPAGRHMDYELSELIDVLNRMMERLEHSFLHVNRFSADVSHELKTPLAVMQAELETAMRTCEPGSASETHLLNVQREAQRLKTITSSLMILAQADAGHLATRRKPFSLTNELEGMCEDVEILCESENISFSSDLEPNIEIESDPNLLRQALQNLLSNAVKYNQEDGTVKITLSKIETENRAVISVANTGPGIPENEREKIFDRFHRADKARSRNIDGFGLGLNLAMEIIRGLGGELALAQADENLTEFEILLPLSQAAEESEA